MRIVLLTYEALAAAAAVRRFVAANPERIALVGLSDVYRPDEGDMLQQAKGHFDRSGPRLFPYLAANFTVPSLAPRRAHGRPGEDPARRPLAETCARLGVPAVLVPDVNDESFRRRIAESGAELIVTFHFDQILRAETIAAAPLGGVNIHAALLPRHRGPVPTIHALMDDEPDFGVTLHRLAPRIDAGPILAQARLALPRDVSAVDAARRLHEAASPLLLQVLDDLAAGRAEERPFEPGPYCGWPTREQLAALARRGRAVARAGDFLAALRTPT